MSEPFILKTSCVGKINAGESRWLVVGESFVVALAENGAMCGHFYDGNEDSLYRYYALTEEQIARLPAWARSRVKEVDEIVDEVYGRGE